MTADMPISHPTIALIVAAGRGSRNGCPIPKQYLPLNHIPMLRHSILAFSNHPAIDLVAVVYHPQDEVLYLEATKDLTLLEAIHGGETRQESVYLGLQKLQAYHPQYVLIHDAARPLVPSSVIDRIITELSPHHGVIPILPIEDTVRHSHTTIDRSSVVRVQTPQGFPFSHILNAHTHAAQTKIKIPFTDDASLYEMSGHSITTVLGSPINFKITTSEDFMFADHYLSKPQSETRTGLGYDVHAFGPAKSNPNSIMICGVSVPHPFSLIGHSDADVGLHALTDALLATIAKEDIGAHFSDKDSAYKDMNSAHFVEIARNFVSEKNGKIIHVDITIIGESPQISPHRLTMRTRVAEILEIDIERVSIKATTTEKLGFTGRKEGIAAQAIASVMF